MAIQDQAPLVSDREFILATRDTGYRSTAAAIAELVDNSLQAKAKRIQVVLSEERDLDTRKVTVSVLDNGKGMDSFTLRQALQFGGTSRFDDRKGLGRFGMGLPNSSVSQAKRLDVYSWQSSGVPVHSYLDVDEIAGGSFRGVPAPRPCDLPSWVKGSRGKSGTLITWSHCDRLDNKKASTIADKLRSHLGRLFRYYLWEGVRIDINGINLVPVDPLFHRIEDTIAARADLLAPLTFEIRTGQSGDRSATVTVRFATLPIEAWEVLSSEEKRHRGIAGGAGVSVVRANREVAYGWYLMGEKRKENYDDWWRCEVAFEPTLDELFGVTHSKQGVTPRPEIAAILAPTLETTARMLNRQVRDRFLSLRGHSAKQPAARLATAMESHLPPPGSVAGNTRGRKLPRVQYKLQVAASRHGDFYSACLKEGILTVVLNQNHPFYETVYVPLTTSGRERERSLLECLLLASARADLELQGTSPRAAALRLKAWSNALAAFLGC